MPVRRLILGLAVTATTALAACGADDGDEPREEPQAAAGACGYDEKTLVPAMEAAVPATSSARVTVDMKGPGTTLGFDAVLAYTPGGVEMEMTSRTPGEEFSMVVADDRYFVAEPDADAGYREIPGDDPLAAQLRSQTASADVTATFAAWRAGLEKVEAVGEEEIDGRPVCRYRLTVDTAAGVAAGGGGAPAGMPATVDYEVFLQRDDLMRRVRFDVMGVTAEVNATHWNEPVTIEVPAGH